MPSDSTILHRLSDEGGEADFDPELDLLSRYDQMIQTQIETINGIDDKAAYTGRLIAVLGGIVLTAASLSASTDAVGFSETTAWVFLMIGIGITALFVSLVFAIVTYLSSTFRYGPSAGLGRFLADYRVDSQEYRDALLRGYSTAISENRRVVDVTSNRFKWCLTTLLVALLYLFGAGVLLVLPDDFRIDITVFIVFSVVAIWLTRYIIRKEYLTLDTEHPYNE